MLRILMLVAFACAAYGQQWNPQKAADYLDGRQKAWFAWKTAQAPGGPCVSCHTGMTYLWARPALRRVLKQNQPTEYETGLVRALGYRASESDAAKISPLFTKPPVSTQAFGTEAILAALFVGEADRVKALDRLMSLQLTDGDAKGAWPWFSLKLDPWEMENSRFYGATLAAMAIDNAPSEYRRKSETRERARKLIDHLDQNESSQPLHNRLMLLWTPSTANALRRVALLEELGRKQESDGGWTFASLGPWKEHPDAPAALGSSAYATGFVAATLRKAGVKASDSRLKRALNWLRSHQDPDTGAWPAVSPNKTYKADSQMVNFMQDAATAFAVMALAH